MPPPVGWRFSSHRRPGAYERLRGRPGASVRGCRAASTRFQEIGSAAAYPWQDGRAEPVPPGIAMARWTRAGDWGSSRSAGIRHGRGAKPRETSSRGLAGASGYLLLLSILEPKD